METCLLGKRQLPRACGHSFRLIQRGKESRSGFQTPWASIANLSHSQVSLKVTQGSKMFPDEMFLKINTLLCFLRNRHFLRVFFHPDRLKTIILCCQAPERLILKKDILLLQ